MRRNRPGGVLGSRRFGGKFLSAVLVVILGGLGSAPVRAADLDKIQDLAQRGRTEEALRRLEGLLVSGPGELEARFLRGVLLAELGRNREAESTFSDLSREFPDRPEPLHNLAVLQALGGRPATASVALGELVDRYPSYETAARNLSRIRGGAAGDAFDPLSPDEARVPLVLTTRLGSYPRAERVEEPAPVPLPARPASLGTPGSETEAVSELAGLLEAAPEPAPEEAAPEPEARPIELKVEPAPDQELEEPEPEDLASEPAVRPIELQVEPAPEPAPVEAVVESELAPADAPAPAAGDLRAELEPVVAAWAAAWSQQRLKDYLGFYAADFQPTGLPSREAWETLRRQRVAAPSFIEVEIDLDSLTVRETGPDEASVTFVQRYRSDRYSDTVEKTLGFAREDGIWRIRTEASR